MPHSTEVGQLSLREYHLLLPQTVSCLSLLMGAE
jgi:hypothetical protein